jgi:hypothetical protein
MELEIQPEPTAGERAAIEAALARVLDGKEPASRWWQEGIRENLEGDEEEPPG